jgi:NitT/TauT family transport system substrate-binding protein
VPDRLLVAVMTGRREFLAGATAGAAALALRAPVSAAAPFRMIVTETEIPLVPNSVVWLAGSMGYFDRAGVKVELTSVGQTPSAVAALRSGGGDMANISTDVVLQLLARDQMKLRGVLSPDKALPFVIVAKKGIGNAKGLEGKTFGVARVGSVDYELSRIVLTKLGADVDKVQYLAVGQPAVRAQSLLAGQIDATTISVGALASITDRSAISVLVNQTDFFHDAPFITKINVITDDVAKTRPKDVAAVARGVMLASRDFAKNPSLWVNAMAKLRPDVKLSDLTALAAQYRTTWSVNGGIDLNAIKFTTSALYQGPDFKDLKRVQPADWIDTSYIDGVLKSIGVDHGMDTPAR